MKISIEEFWKRFQEKSDRLMDLDSLNAEDRESLLDSVDEDIKQYSEGLSLEIGKLGTNGRKLTLTADGDEYEIRKQLIEKLEAQYQLHLSLRDNNVVKN